MNSERSFFFNRRKEEQKTKTKTKTKKNEGSVVVLKELPTNKDKKIRCKS